MAVMSNESITPPTTPYAYAVSPAPEEPTPPGRVGPRWTAKKTAVTAGLAIVLASAGAIGAAAAMPAGSTGGESVRGPGGGRSFQLPGGGMGGIDPNRLSQQDPQDLLRQLNQGVGDTKTT